MNRPSLIAAVVMMALSAGAFAQQAGEEPKKEPESAKAPATPVDKLLVTDQAPAPNSKLPLDVPAATASAAVTVSAKRSSIDPKLIHPPAIVTPCDTSIGVRSRTGLAMPIRTAKGAASASLRASHRHGTSPIEASATG